jgi:hypothetical protein
MTIFAGFKPNSLKLAKHRVAVLAYDGVVLGDLATPLEIFGRVRDAEGKPCYDVRVCGAAQEVQSEHVNLKVPWGLSSVARAGTVPLERFGGQAQFIEHKAPECANRWRRCCFGWNVTSGRIFHFP